MSGPGARSPDAGLTEFSNQFSSNSFLLPTQSLSQYPEEHEYSQKELKRGGGGCTPFPALYFPTWPSQLWNKPDTIWGGLGWNAGPSPELWLQGHRLRELPPSPRQLLTSALWILFRLSHLTGLGASTYFPVERGSLLALTEWRRVRD